MRDPFYLVTAIPYVNAPPHIGHALLFIYADIMARYERLLGHDVRFLIGTDEHGQKIAQKARDAGKEPRQFVDEMSETVRDMARLLNVSQTDFVRTTEERHHKAVEVFWQRVSERGHIYKKRYGGLYCVGCEQFKTEKDLVNGECPDHKTRPEYIEEENYFFRLSAFQDALLQYYAAHPNYVIPEHRFNEMKRLVEQGLEDVSISRSTERLSWGIPVPGDETQVIYVWFDALINYLTGAGFAFNETDFARFWPADLQVLGQEINRFHSILWVAMLMAAEIEVPKQFAVHGWITVDGQKMSKSIGNVILPEDLAARYTTEGMRYLLAREFLFAGDGDYKEDQFRARYEADLANGLGNLVSRVTSMVEKYRGGLLPDGKAEAKKIWLTQVQHIEKVYQETMQTCAFTSALEQTWALITAANQYIDQTKPWSMAKEGKEQELDAVLYGLCEAIRHIAWMIRPVMPTTSEKILDAVGEKPNRDQGVFGQAKLFEEGDWDVTLWGGLEVGTRIQAVAPLFPRLG